MTSVEILILTSFWFVLHGLTLDLLPVPFSGVQVNFEGHGGEGSGVERLYQRGGTHSCGQTQSDLPQDASSSPAYGGRANCGRFWKGLTSGSDIKMAAERSWWLLYKVLAPRRWNVFELGSCSLKVGRDTGQRAGAEGGFICKKRWHLQCHASIPSKVELLLPNKTTTSNTRRFRFRFEGSSQLLLWLSALASMCSVV